MNCSTKQANLLGKIKTGLISAYHSKTKMAKSKLSNLMSAETWMTAKEAKEMGFADTITDEVAAQATFDLLNRYRNVPGHLNQMAVVEDNMRNKTEKQIEAKCKAEWNRDKAVRDEFMEFENYLHYELAKENGQIKHIRR